ncbi:MAG TPA: response regulator, partial [Clostridia bacterium]|nr:response regulator [Clostridia bacterium]
EHLPRIFEPFFTTKELGKGTGLGLATVYGIVKQHQGWIEVSSQPGTGTTFHVYFPAISAPSESALESPTVPKPRGGSESILLVEDDDAVRLLTRRILEKFGYQVYEASSGAAALEMWDALALKIDLLLTDVIMPEGITGRDLAERLRAKKPGLKIVFTSGYSGDMLGHDTEFLHRTQSRFLAKPCSPDELMTILRACLDQDSL